MQGLRTDTQRHSAGQLKGCQATWSPRERAKRNRGPLPAWWMPSAIRLFTLSHSNHLIG